jgi:hypothetical protein
LQNYKFTGYERDGETGLDYALARYYNDSLGRFKTTCSARSAIDVTNVYPGFDQELAMSPIKSWLSRRSVEMMLTYSS